MGKPSIQVSIHGRRFGLGPKSELIVNDANAGLQDAVIEPSARARVLVAAAAAAAANSTPVDLVPAPGAGKALLLTEATVSKAAGAAFTGIAAGEDVRITYEAAAEKLLADIESTGFLDQTTDQMRMALPIPVTPGLGDVNLQNLENDKIVFSLLVGDIADGSDLVVDVRYRIIDLAPLLA